MEMRIAVAHLGVCGAFRFHEKGFSVRDLKIDRLDIRNYRSLENVQIERLGRLNLVTGKNNVGKTSFLEAVRLWAAGTDVSTLLQIIDTRDESLVPDRISNSDRGKKAGDHSLLGCLFLFSGYPSIETVKDPIKITCGESTLLISIEDRVLKQDLLSDFAHDMENILPSAKSLELSMEHSESVTSILLPNYYSDDVRRRIHVQHRVANPKAIPCAALAARTSSLSDFASPSTIWDKIALTSREDIVTRGLNIIDSRIERVVFVQGGDQLRIPMVRLAGLSSPVPLRGLGDGVYRVFEIMLAMVSAEGGVVVIDEFENGLHYSVQETAWETILDLANKLDVQVFATTHSSDCVHAFERVSETTSEGEMMLTRLTRDEVGVRAETLLGKKLALRLDLGQEVR